MSIMGSDYFGVQEVTWNPDAFLKMYNLRFLQVDCLDHVPTHLPGHLRVLDWFEYPLKSLPSSFLSNELVQLHLQSSKIEQLWIGIKVSVLLNILKTTLDRKKCNCVIKYPHNFAFKFK